MTDRSAADRRLAALGMTDEEIALWAALARVAGRFLQLPVLHPLERPETAAVFHQLQNRLLARPGLRAEGWPRPEQEDGTGEP